MAVEIRVPPLGESLVDAVVGTWLKQEGDSVNRGESLVELETDKVNLDVTAEDDGILSRIERREGEVVTVGEVLGLVSSSNGAAAPTPRNCRSRDRSSRAIAGTSPRGYSDRGCCPSPRTRCLTSGNDGNPYRGRHRWRRKRTCYARGAPSC